MSTTQHTGGAATVQEFAEALDVSRWTVQRLIAAEQIHSVKIGKSRRIPWSELPRVLAKNEVPTKAA